LLGYWENPNCDMPWHEPGGGMKIGLMKWDSKRMWGKVLHGASSLCSHKAVTDWSGCTAGTQGDVRNLCEGVTFNLTY
jgi:hypothetical protein